MANYKIFKIPGHCSKDNEVHVIPVKYAPLPHNRWEKAFSVAECRDNCKQCPIFEQAPEIIYDDN